jgi:hypothetical protein
MTDCRHRQDRTRHEFNRNHGTAVVEVLGCETHGECTLADAGVVVADLMAPVDPNGCDHRGDKIREGEGTCCSGGPIIVYACDVYDECTAGGGPGGERACARCHRHTDRERRVMVCDRCVDRAP